jgi:hypothetical protein
MCLWANSSQGLVRRVTRLFEPTKRIPLDFYAYLVHAWKTCGAKAEAHLKSSARYVKLAAVAHQELRPDSSGGKGPASEEDYESLVDGSLLW